MGFEASPYVPIALGFFGLGTGYFIWGGQALFGFPKEDSPEVSQSLGYWAIWMPGFMQFLAGIILLIGLTWFNVFGGSAPLYAAGIAFATYGIHWFAMGQRRLHGTSPAADGWMGIAFALISILGIISFWAAGDIPVAFVFIGLTLIYLSEIVTRFNVAPWGRVVGFWQFITGIWLMYLTYATVLNLANGYHLWL